MGKGSKPRPYSVDQETYAANYDRIFSDGARLGANSASKAANEGSIPSAPAIYVDDETGKSVTEDWWPGMPFPKLESEGDEVLCLAPKSGYAAHGMFCCLEKDHLGEHTFSPRYMF